MSISPHNGGFHCSTGGSAVCAGPPSAVAKVAIFNVALPGPDADGFPRLAINSSAIIFASLPCQQRKVLIVRLAGYTAMIVTRDYCRGNGGVKRGGSFGQQTKGPNHPCRKQLRPRSKP